MKKINFLFAFLFSAAMQAQHIPDSNFANAIRQDCPTCIDANNDLTTAAQSLTSLNISWKSISDLTGIAGFTSLTELICYSNLLTSLPSLPANLYYLDCSYNQLTSLPTLPTSLDNLDCGSNLLTNLPTLPSTLTFLNCYSNHLTSLPTLPASLEGLISDINQLTSLPTLPGNLKNLVCASNPLTSLPTLPSTLTYLNCSGDQLTSLPTLPTGLINLSCNNNQLTSLPTLPASLEWLSCNNNQLTTLPTLPASLSILFCNHNQLTTLPTLVNIDNIECSYNQLTSLPALPASVDNIDCSYNQLTSLPALPQYLGNLNCSNNPNIYCLPEITHDIVLDFSATAITCVPTHTYCQNISTPEITTLPICTSSSPCFIDPTIGTQNLENSTLKMYPNPTSDLLWIDYDFAQNSENTLFITDMLGRNAASVKLSGSGKESVSLQGLANGIYQANLWNGEKLVSMGRVVKY